MVNKSFADKVDEAIDNRLAYYIYLAIALAFTTPVNMETGRIISRIILGEEAKALHSFAFAIILEVGIFILAASGDRKTAKYFMYYSIFAHILYFRRWEDFIELSFPQEKLSELDYYLKLSLSWVKFLLSIGTSIVAPVLVYNFSDKIAMKRHILSLQSQIEKYTNELATIQRQKADTERNVATLSDQLAIYKKELVKLETQKANVINETAELSESIEKMNAEIKSLRNRKNAMGSRSATSGVLTDKQD